MSYSIRAGTKGDSQSAVDLYRTTTGRRPAWLAVSDRTALPLRPVVLGDVAHSGRPLPPPDRERSPVPRTRELLRRRDRHARRLSRTAISDAEHLLNVNAGRRCPLWRSSEHFPRSLAWYFRASGSCLLRERSPAWSGSAQYQARRPPGSDRR